MGALCAVDKSLETKQSKEIERQIKEDRKGAAKHHKLLLLGTGDSGKSTFAKQMRFLHSPVGMVNEYAKFQGVLRENCLFSAVALFDLCDALNVKVPYEIQAYQTEIKQATLLTIDLAKIIEQMWSEKAVKDAFQERAKASHVQILSSAAYYFTHAVRFAQPDFQPTEMDVTMAKLRTCGAIETSFTIEGTTFTMIDVGGQRNEQRKWIHCFENVMAVIYLVALDEYDMTLEEDNQTNRFDESLGLFSSVTGSQWFKANTCILFLNKIDLFEEKIKQVPLHKRFPDIPEGADLQTCLDYIQAKYQGAFSSTKLFVYTTCAIDKENCEKVFNSIRSAVFIDNIDKSGLYL